MSTEKYSVLQTSDIIANPIKLREVNKESVDYLELVESIRKDGVINAITVRSVAGELGAQYQLIDGLHRLTPARDVGLLELTVQVIDLDDIGVLMHQITMNSHNIQTRPVEYTNQLKQILTEKPLMTIGELGKEIGKSAAWINQRLSLGNITNEVTQGLVNEGNISLVNAYSLATLPEEEQDDWLTAAQTESITEFAPKVAARLKELRAASRQARDANPVGFVAIASIRKLGVLKDAPSDSELIARLATQASTIEEAIVVGINYTMKLDPESLVKQEQDYNDKKEADKQAKEDRSRKRKEAAAEKAAEASESLSKEADEALQ